MKRKINIVWKEKKGSSGSNQIRLIHLNVSKFFKKQH